MDTYQTPFATSPGFLLLHSVIRSNAPFGLDKSKAGIGMKMSLSAPSQCKFTIQVWGSN